MHRYQSSMPFDIVAYDYRGDRYAPADIIDAYRDIRIRNGVFMHPYDGTSDVEALLDAYAAYRGIDRYDERSFDSSDFPKVVFRDQVED